MKRILAGAETTQESLMKTLIDDLATALVIATFALASASTIVTVFAGT